ncbi:MAG: serine/threonine-protein kinase, partial [Cyanobacteria bacterium P01_A01_bin.135]
MIDRDPSSIALTMLCCLNPRCPKPINPDGAAICRGCRRRLISELRGRYRPLHLIGQGGFGRTYLAEDCDRLKALCVIKQLSPQVTGTESTRKATALFTREAVRLDELGEHPQIPALLAYFEQDGYLYLVQQYIEGVSLAQELQRNGPFNEANVRRVLLDLLPVLQFVHARQVIHRDITPTNILRRRRDHRLVLIDFGVAKQLRLESGQQPGTQIGTEGYAPVEQLRGGQAYPASD